MSSQSRVSVPLLPWKCAVILATFSWSERLSSYFYLFYSFSRLRKKKFRIIFLLHIYLTFRRYKIAEEKMSKFWFIWPLSCVYNCDDQSYIHVIPRSSNIWSFIYALAVLPWSQRFFLIFLLFAKRRERKTPGHPDPNLTFMQTSAVKHVKLIITKGNNGNLAITCLSAANVFTRVVRSGITWPSWPGSTHVFARMFSSGAIATVLSR